MILWRRIESWVVGKCLDVLLWQAAKKLRRSWKETV